MIRLTATTEKLQIVLAGAVTTNQLHCFVSFTDVTATATTPGETATASNNTAETDICAAPAASTTREIDFISVRNRDTAAATVSILKDISGTNWELFKATLGVNDVLQYTHAQGWKIVQFTTPEMGTRVKGQTGANNAGTPLTQYDFAADEVLLRATDGSQVLRRNTGTVTLNISTAGPAANGRDQAGAFSASSWIYAYWIWNGATLATIASVSAPSVGPNLPAGYTHFAFITVLRLNASTQLLSTKQYGNLVSYTSYQNVLNGGSATTETSITVSSFVPPNAQGFHIDVDTIQIRAPSSGSPTADVTLRLGTVSGSIFCQLRVGTSGIPLSTYLNPNGGTVFIPGVTLFYYLVITGNGVEQAATLHVMGYKIPNGDS